MTNENSNLEIFSFSQSELKRHIANNLDKIAWVCIFFVIVYTIISASYVNVYSIILVIFLTTIPYFYHKLQQKFAHKIVVDFTSNKIRLHMYRSDRIITSDFNDIKSIRVNGYIIVILKEEKVFYNDLQNDGLFECLNKIRNISWGPLCALWGPNKNVRNTVAEQRKEL